MKKTMIALGLAGVMMFGGAMSVMATEADEMTAVDYSMIDETVFEGRWFTAFGVFDIYLPSDDWKVTLNATSDEEAQDNVYFAASNDDQTESVAISYAASEFTDINDVAEAYAATEGMSDVEVVSVNDIYCVSYICETEEAWTTGLVALGDQGGLYNVTVGCALDEKDDFQATATNILVSFSATEGEAATEE